jgi:hypothetical protein
MQVLTDARLPRLVIMIAESNLQCHDDNGDGYHQ